MIVKNSRGSDIVWECYDHEGEQWFKSHISLYDFSAVNTVNQDISDKLQKILKNAVRYNSEFLSKWNGFKVQTFLEFPSSYGLGSSSSLYSLVGQWAEVHPLQIFFRVEDGSGYDVACSDSGAAITYQLVDDDISYTPVGFAPSFHKSLYFVHLNEKQDSSVGIKDYLKAVKRRKSLVNDISKLTEEFLRCSSLSAFADLIDRHEDLIHSHTGFSKVKDNRFDTYWGAIKSLGAWGGDFVLATSDRSEVETKEYFAGLGYPTVFSYDELIFSD